MTTGKSAKRAPPAPVPPLTIGSMRIDVVHWARDDGFGQNGGVLRATDLNTGAELWTLKVYTIDYDASRETDVQDIFITSVRKAIFGNRLIVKDERGRRFKIDLATRAVTQA
jgi:hypothetical protein